MLLWWWMPSLICAGWGGGGTRYRCGGGGGGGGGGGCAVHIAEVLHDILAWDYSSRGNRQYTKRKAGHWGKKAWVQGQCLSICMMQSSFLQSRTYFLESACPVPSCPSNCIAPLCSLLSRYT